MSTGALDQLVADLDAEFAGEARGKRIAALLADYTQAHEDWRTFALFAADCYARNLVHRGESFELMILCWGAGHASPIHNHEGQDCWMGVLEGDIEELRYVAPTEVRPGPLEPTEAAVFGAGQVAYIRDEIGLHLVRPFGEGRVAVSLHLYAAPYDECSVYCPETGRVTRKQLSNYSDRGQLCGEGV